MDVSSSDVTDLIAFTWPRAYSCISERVYMCIFEFSILKKLNSKLALVYLTYSQYPAGSKTYFSNMSFKSGTISRLKSNCFLIIRFSSYTVKGEFWLSYYFNILFFASFKKSYKPLAFMVLFCIWINGIEYNIFKAFL